MKALELAEKLDIEFQPQYIMQDACDASYNASINIFPDCVVLMCYFHVVLICKKQKNLIPVEFQPRVFTYWLKRLHLTSSRDHFLKYYSDFVKFCKENCLDFVKYIWQSWLSSIYNILFFLFYLKN